MIKKINSFEKFLLTFATVFLVFFGATSFLFASKIKDVTNVVGVRDNQLIGYGLVVGLQGTGDGTTSKFTAQSLANLLQSANLNINQNDIKSKNIAAVMVTATLPPFARQGDKVDITISSIGDAKSLEGGTLLLTPLKGLDGRIYAISQGDVTVGGFNSAGGIGQANHTASAKVLGGAIIEREIVYDLYSKQDATLSLKNSSFENAIRIQDVINSYYEIKVAIAIDPRTIKLKKPQNLSMIEFLASVENLEIETDNIKKIIVQERTGTIIAGINIEVKPINVTHGNFSLSIDNTFIDSENKSITVSSITKALQKMGATPRDIISILQAIKKSGAIDAELEVI